MKENNNSKQVLLSVLGVAILVVAVVGVSFAAFTYTGTGQVENIITTGSITMNYEEPENGIKLTEALPMTDAQGKALTGENNTFDFTVTASVTGSATIDYAIIAIPDEGNSGTALTDATVKVYLTDSTTDSNDNSSTGVGNTTTPVPLSTLASSDTASSAGVPSSLGGYVLATGTYSGASNTDSYRLRMWMADTATAPSTSETYKLRVNVYGQANAQ